MNRRTFSHQARNRIRTALVATIVTAASATTIAVTSGSASATQNASLKTLNSKESGAYAEAALGAYEVWISSRQPMAWIDYVARRDQLAAVIADGVGVDRAGLTNEWANTGVQNQIVVVAALSQLGVAYRYNTLRPGESFDCSGLTKWAYEQAGLQIPRISWDQIRAATTVGRDEAQPGDLVQYPGHIGVYLGQGGYIDSPESGSVIRVHGLPGRKRLHFGDATPN